MHFTLIMPLAVSTKEYKLVTNSKLLGQPGTMLCVWGGGGGCGGRGGGDTSHPGEE